MPCCDTNNVRIRVIKGSKSDEKGSIEEQNLTEWQIVRDSTNNRTYSGINLSRDPRLASTRGTLIDIPLGSTVGLQTLVSHGTTSTTRIMQLVQIWLRLY